jgi:curli biogenesis system outer membrane secretion channel CsgG
MQIRKPLLWLIIPALLASCDAGPTVQLAADEQPIMIGSRVRRNTTILTDTFVCFDNALAKAGKKPLKIAVGNIADYTGKTSDSEGAVITRGGSLMLFSALGLMKYSVKLQDRFDTTVTDMEMKYVNARQLGDGTEHTVENEKVPWMPYFGGSILKSDYVIMGGITEVNFNLSSGGFNAEMNQTGFKRRTFAMSIAADLRLVKTDSLEVVATSSFQKQFTGREVSANLFSFFDVFNNKQLFDVYGGDISQEPMQLGVRTILEEATLELLSHANSLDYHPCTVPMVPVKAAPLPEPAKADPQKLTPAPVAAAEPALSKDLASVSTTQGTTATAGKQPPSALAAAKPAKLQVPQGTARLLIGSFTVQANANAALEQAKANGIPAKIEAYIRDNRPWWIVVAFVSHDQATLDEIKHLGFPDAFFAKN